MHQEHGLRRKLVSEMHLRRWPPMSAPTLIVQVLRLVGEAGREAERALLDNPPKGGERDPTDNPKHVSGTLAGGIIFRWEQHTEASALTLLLPNADPASMHDPAANPAMAAALGWSEQFPGELIRATRIALVTDDATAEAMLPNFEFIGTDLVSCHVGPMPDGPEPVGPTVQSPRIWSDFRIGAGGFGGLVIAANGLGGGDLSRLVQRLQELGNYRNMALLGLPVAQQCWSDLSRIETRLSDLARDVSSPEITDDALLDTVSALSLDLMTLSTRSSYRMSATAAYAQLVEERLTDVAPRTVPGYQSLTEFTQRRLLPAVRTCAALTRREESLTQRSAAFTALLRTRIETRIENQNARLLKSMERTASLQLRMQQLVEGLSVVALSYYCLSLIAYVLKGWESIDEKVHAPAIIAVLVPVTLGGMWWGIHHMKSRLLGGDGDEH